MQTGGTPGHANRNQRTSNRKKKKRPTASGKATPTVTTRSTKRGSGSPVTEMSKLLVILWLFSSFLYAFLWK